MRRTAWLSTFAVLLATLALHVAVAAAGNALAGPSSYVGPSSGVARSAPPPRIRRAASPPAVAKPSRIPFRDALPYRQPTVSPWLNIFRPDASRVFNYYTLVRPQLAQLQINQQRAAQIQALTSQAATIQGGRNDAGGHFMAHGSYFGSAR